MTRDRRSGGSHGASTRTSWPRSKRDSVSASTWRLTPPGYVHEYGLTIAMRIEIGPGRAERGPVERWPPSAPSGYRTVGPPKSRDLPLVMRCPGDAGRSRAYHRADHQEERPRVVRERARDGRRDRPREAGPQDVAGAEPPANRAPPGQPGHNQRDDDPEDRRGRVAGEAVGGELEATLEHLPEVAEATRVQDAPRQVRVAPRDEVDGHQRGDCGDRGSDHPH